MFGRKKKMDTKNEIPNENTELPEEDKKKSSEEIDPQYAVRITEPAVVASFGSADGLFIKNISDQEAEIFVNGEVRVIGTDLFERV